MYEEYWQLTDKPFPYRIPASQCFSTETQCSALLRLKYCVANHAGCSLVLGESGLGKTTLLRQFEANSTDLKPFVYLSYPGLRSGEQLRLLCSQLSDTPSNTAAGADELLQEIAASLHRWSASKRHPVICFDDAQLLNSSVMTNVILPLLNLREIDEAVSLTLVLAGQPVLASHVSRHIEIRERIAVTARLSGMSCDEVRDYVRGRMNACGRSETVFADSALEQLYRSSQGNPRRLNRMCDMALLVGCADELSVIEAPHINAVATELMTAA